ncbi:protein NETWORKED 3A-like [Vigna umbellata]|uniref:protein NETWORKED 3A-like n=1 Tax=Vigna umbellata TaxID=87088 RepID=UPI001F5F6359|nr:protein NETWORKED 3A-like [Vigna umbellata]
MAPPTYVNYRLDTLGNGTSQWLQTTISDLDEKLDAMKTILDGDNSPKELMHCEWREDLIEMLEDFGQSYRVLAIAYNQLKLKTSQGTFQSGSLSSSGTSRTICSICNKRMCSLEHSNIKIDRSILGFDLSNEQGDECHELLSAGTCSTKLKPERRNIQMEDRMTKFSTTEEKIDDSELHQRTEDPPMISFKCDNLWSTLKYQTKLIQDNLHQLLLLVQRNDEKRETIRRLRLKVETLKTENRALQISLTHSNADSECDQPQTSRAGGRSTGKLFKI